MGDIMPLALLDAAPLSPPARVLHVYCIQSICASGMASREARCCGSNVGGRSLRSTLAEVHAAEQVPGRDDVAVAAWNAPPGSDALAHPWGTTCDMLALPVPPSRLLHVD